MMDYKVKVRKK